MDTSTEAVLAPAVRAEVTALPDLTLARMINAPRQLVFRAWTHSECVAAWWGPHGFSNPVCDVDPRPGGRFTVHMQGPEGAVYPGGGVFLEIEPPRLLIFTSTLEGKGREALIDAVNTVTFEDLDGRTRLIVNARVVRAAREASRNLAGLEDGWRQSLERLSAILKAI